MPRRITRRRLPAGRRARPSRRTANKKKNFISKGINQVFKVARRVVKNMTGFKQRAVRNLKAVNETRVMNLSTRIIWDPQNHCISWLSGGTEYPITIDVANNPEFQNMSKEWIAYKFKAAKFSFKPLKDHPTQQMATTSPSTVVNHIPVQLPLLSFYVTSARWTKIASMSAVNPPAFTLNPNSLRAKTRTINVRDGFYHTPEELDWLDPTVPPFSMNNAMNLAMNGLVSPGTELYSFGQSFTLFDVSIKYILVGKRWDSRARNSTTQYEMDLMTFKQRMDKYQEEQRIQAMKQKIKQDILDEELKKKITAEVLLDLEYNKRKATNQRGRKTENTITQIEQEFIEEPSEKPLSETFQEICEETPDLSENFEEVAGYSMDWKDDEIFAEEETSKQEKPIDNYPKTEAPVTSKHKQPDEQFINKNNHKYRRFKKKNERNEYLDKMKWLEYDSCYTSEDDE